MTLAAGTKLGPYEILAPLGAGGMERYWARDTRLERMVAVKVLPERLAEDADALARFGPGGEGGRGAPRTPTSSRSTTSGTRAASPMP